MFPLTEQLQSKLSTESVVFIDPVTSNTITVQSNQVLTLPPAQQNGFSNDELQSYVSSLNMNSVDQWWSSATSPSNNLFILVAIVLAIVAVAAVAAVLVLKGRKKGQPQAVAAEPTSEQTYGRKKTGTSPTMTKNRLITQAVVRVEQPKFRFCPNCGKQLLMAKNLSLLRKRIELKHKTKLIPHY